MKQNLLRSFHVRPRSLRGKIMLSLLLVSLLTVGSISVVSLGVSRTIIMDNSEQLARSIVLQISLNLDDRVKNFEDATYSILQQQAIRSVFSENRIADPLDRQYTETVFQDVINLSPTLYRYVRFAYLETQVGQRYHYSRYEYQSPADDTAERLSSHVRGQLTKQSPILWFRWEEEVYFARLLVDDRSFAEHGLAVFCVTPPFFSLAEDQEILSRDSFLISTRGGKLLYAAEYNLQDPTIRALTGSPPPTGRMESSAIRYRGQKTLVTSVSTPRKGWNIHCLIRASDLYQKDRAVIVLDLLIACTALGVSVLLTVIISRTITGNLSRMEESMARVEEGDFKVRMHPSSYDEIGRLGLRFNYMVQQMEGLIHSVAQERLSKQEAEFQALQAQVNPHFLYNTLGSMKWLANRRGEGELESMADALIDLLKGSIRKGASYQTFAEEIDYVKSYIHLQKMRYGDVFRMEYQIQPQTEHAVVPGFLLQPLVENSIYHGIDVAKTDGLIRISSWLEDEVLVIQVEDNGRGIPPGQIEKILHQSKQYKGFNSIGANLVRKRIEAHCPGGAFSIRSEQGKGTRVEIRLPYSTQLPEEERT